MINRNITLLRNIQSIKPKCDSLQTIDEWQNKLKDGMLSVLHLNIRSVKKYWDFLCLKLTHVLPSLDILVITETKLNEEEALSYQLRNFTQISKCRLAKTGGGGVMVFLKNNLIFENLSYNFDESENLALKLTCDNPKMNFILLAVYRSPKMNLDRFVRDIEFWLQNATKKDQVVLVVGDINIDILKKSSTNSSYMNMLYNNSMIPYINSLITREEMVDGRLTSSCIDHINLRCNLNKYLVTSAVIKDKLADHYFVALTLSHKDSTLKPRNSTEYIDIIDNKAVDEKIQHVEWDKFQETEEPKELYENIVSQLSSIYESSIRRTKKNDNKYTTPWVSERLKQQIKLRNNVLKKWQNNKNNRLFYEEYKVIRNTTTNMIKKEKRIYFYKLFQESQGNMVQTWKIINNLMDRKIFEPNESKLKRNFQTDDLPGLSNNFNKNFINQVLEIKERNRGPTMDVQTVDYIPHGHMSSMYLRKASYKDVNCILKKMKKRGQGFDKVRSKDIVNHSIIFTPILTKLINLMLEKNFIPDELKVSSITPLYKKGKSDVLGNYRPVGSLSIIDKVLEKHINIHTQNYLEDNNIIPDFQYGFQKGKSTISLLQDVSELINSALDQRKCIVILCLDLSFAFDTIDHSVLLKKFKDIGIHNPILETYFESRRQVTKLGNSVSDVLPVRQSLVQGSINSPTWYNVYTYDVKYLKLQGKLKMFADDSCIISIDSDVETAVANAQADFINLQKYFYNNHIYLNEKKTEALILGYKSKRTNMNDLKIVCHSRPCLSAKTYETQICQCHQIEYTENTKYLGVTIDNDFKMKQHVIHLCKKMRIIKYKLNKINAESFPLSTKKLMYFSLIDSILRYGVTLYTYAPQYVLDPLNRIQKQIIKLLFNQTPVSCMTPDQLSKFVLIYSNFSDPRFRQLTAHSYALRNQRFCRIKVNTVLYGNRRLEYAIPTLLNMYCHEFLEEKNVLTLKKKLKESILEISR